LNEIISSGLAATKRLSNKVEYVRGVLKTARRRLGSVDLSQMPRQGFALVAAKLKVPHMLWYPASINAGLHVTCDKSLTKVHDVNTTWQLCHSEAFFSFAFSDWGIGFSHT
jgi:hypothetical protein